VLRIAVCPGCNTLRKLRLDGEFYKHYRSGDTECLGWAEVGRESMQQQTTHVLAITDMSGSMAHLASDVRGGHNAYRASLIEDRENRYTMTIVLFNTDVRLLCENVPVERSPELTNVNYWANGNTALLDAVSMGIARFRQGRFVQPGDKVHMMIQTDGEENSSQENTKEDIAELLRQVQQEGWSVVYAGQGIAAWHERHAYGMHSNSVNVRPDRAGTQSFYTAAAGVTRSYAAGETRPEDTAKAMQDAMDAEVRDQEVS